MSKKIQTTLAVLALTLGVALYVFGRVTGNAVAALSIPLIVYAVIQLFVLYVLLIIDLETH